MSLPLTLLVLSTSAACAVSPTGRRQFLMYPPSQMAELGAQAFADMKQQQTVSNDPAINRYVACVADAIIQANRSRVGDNWEVVVFADDQANAFALPGGKVGVYTGLLRVAENADQLAAVIGHEIGHVVAQHGNERMSQGAIANLGMGLLSAYGEGGENRQMILAALGIGYDLGVAKPHSRGQESEADNYGLALMSNAGFNPQAAIDLWHNMEALGQSPPEIMSTHPSPATRIKQLSELQGEAVPLYNAARSIGQTPDCVAPNLPAPAGS
ncbi:MAG: M48 family metallopeptidase [Myxococcota bacterium]